MERFVARRSVLCAVALVAAAPAPPALGSVRPPQAALIAARGAEGTFVSLPGGRVRVIIDGVSSRVERFGESPVRALAPIGPAALPQSWRPLSAGHRTLVTVELAEGRKSADSFTFELTSLRYSRSAHRLVLVGRQAARAHPRVRLTRNARDRRLPSDFGRSSILIDRNAGGRPLRHTSATRTATLAWAAPRDPAWHGTRRGNDTGGYPGESAWLVAGWGNAWSVSCTVFSYGPTAPSYTINYSAQDPGNGNIMDPGWTYSGPTLGAPVVVNTPSTLGYANWSSTFAASGAPSPSSFGNGYANINVTFTVDGTEDGNYDDYLYAWC